MCGIFGILKTEGTTVDQGTIAQAKQACILMAKRGPDDEGMWFNDSTVFSFRRLSILDLSEAGHQPMRSTCGQYTIVFNGELYNFQDIKEQLLHKGYVFHSRTDTEVVMNALIEWGPAALIKFNGMYAIGFWDAKNRSVLIARDHVGMKPLYYAYVNNTFVFGSQLDQVMQVVGRQNLHVDKTALALYLSVGYYPSPRTVFHEIAQLEAGKWMQVDCNGKVTNGSHFDLLSFYLENKSNIVNIDELLNSLTQSVKRHLMSDVPIGTFLSGGLDSGIITGLVNKFVGADFTAYTLSNKGTVYDEAERASQVATYLQIPHRIIYPNNILDTVLKFQEAYQEPFGDYSAISAILVTAEAKKEVKVMLSGDGSDEFFFGYNRMTSMLKSASYYRYPYMVRRLLKKIKSSIPAITFADFPTMIFMRQNHGDRTVLSDLEIKNEDLAYEFIYPFGDSKNIEPDMVIKLNTIYRYFQLQLLKLDRASMYNSVEARVPFADKELMKHTIAYRAKDVTEENYEVRKVPLQKIYNGLFPYMSLQEGRKMGFTIDMESMLKGNLKEYFLEMCNEPSIFDQFIDFKKIRANALKGMRQGTLSKWSLLSLQMWSKRYYS